MTGPEAERHIGIADWRVEGGGGVLDRIENGNVVGAVLGRSIKRAVCVDSRIAPVRGDEVVEVMLFIHPIAEGDHEVALHALRTLRFGMRKFAPGDAVGPIGEILDGQRAHSGQLAHHELRGLSRLHPAYPGLFGSVEVPQGGLDGARGKLAELVAANAAVVFHFVEPLGLRHLGGDSGIFTADGIVAVELVGGGNLQHRVPIDRRIILRCGGFVGSDHGGEIQMLAGFSHHFRAIHQSIAADPDAVGRFGQFGNEVTATIVGDDNLDVSHRQIARFGDHPDAGFRTIGAGDHATDVIAIDGDGGSA